MSTTSPSLRRSDAGSARAFAVLLLALAMFAAGALSSWWYFTQRRPPARPTPAADFGPLTPSAAPVAPVTEPTAPPPALAAPSPGASAPASPPGPTPTPAPAASPAAGRAHAVAAKPRAAKLAPVPAANPVAQMLSQADSAVSEKRFADAADLYERVLRLDPNNEAARAGKARLGPPGTTRVFVLGATTLESLRPPGK